MCQSAPRHPIHTSFKYTQALFYVLAVFQEGEHKFKKKRVNIKLHSVRNKDLAAGQKLQTENETEQIKEC